MEKTLSEIRADNLSGLINAMGWQGGTVWQIIQSVNIGPIMHRRERGAYYTRYIKYGDKVIGYFEGYGENVKNYIKAFKAGDLIGVHVC